MTIEQIERVFFLLILLLFLAVFGIEAYVIVRELMLEIYRYVCLSCRISYEFV